MVRNRIEDEQGNRVGEHPLVDRAHKLSPFIQEGGTIAKNQNTFAKRQREMEKKRKAEEKRQRRLDRKSADPELPASSPEATAEVNSGQASDTDDA